MSSRLTLVLCAGFVAGAGIGAGTALASPTYSDTVLADNPLAYWRMNDTAGASVTDSSGGTATPGTLSGSYSSSALSPIANDSSARSINFSGGSFTATMEATVRANMTAGQQSGFTVEWWMHPDTRTNYNQGLGNTWGTWLFHTTSTGQVYTGQNTGDGSTRFGPAHLGNDTLELDKWQHFVYAFDGAADGTNSKTARFYKNGVQLSTLQLGGGNAWDVFGIGASADGEVAEVAVYNHALSGSRVQAHYNEALAVPEPAAVGLAALALPLLRRRAS